MKRIFSLLTVFVMVFALSGPAFAVSSIYSYNGYEFPDVESVIEDREKYPYLSIYQSAGGEYHLVGTRLHYVYTDSHDFVVKNDPAVFYKFEDGEWVLTSSKNANSVTAIRVSEGYNIIWVNLDARTKSGSGDVVYSASEPVFVSSRVCDGSTCPAVDANVDGICDECGMMLRLVSPQIVLPTVTGSNLKTALFKGTFDNINGYLYSTITSTTPYTIKAERLNENYRVMLSESATVQNFVSSDGVNWNRIYNTKTTSFFPAPVEGVVLIASDYDWVTGDGEPFFPLPLWKEMETVTQGEMMGLMSETGGTMKTLVVCGVGLMACLVVLSLFGKRSLLFLR